jgi:hypothetical protein
MHQLDAEAGIPHFGKKLSRHVSYESKPPSDEDISAVDTTVASTHPHVPGPPTRARARQLNYQVLSFLGTHKIFLIHMKV